MLKKRYRTLKIFVFICASAILTVGYIEASPGNAANLILNWQMEEARRVMDGLDDVPPQLEGLYSFYMGDYEKACEGFSRSPESFPRMYNITAKLAPLRKKFEFTESRYFKIYSAGRDRVMALYAGEILDSAAENLKQHFGYIPSRKKVILEIYPDKESFQTASTLTDEQMKASGAVGICKFNRLMVSSPAVLKFGYRWADTITHEYVHYIIGKITGLENMPLWLNEGLARYYEQSWENKSGEFTPHEKNLLYLNRQDNIWVRLEKMKYGMPNLDDRDEVSLAYAQVHSMVDYMTKEYDSGIAGKLLYELADKNADEAFKDILKLSVEDFFSRWQDYIARKDIPYSKGAAGANYAFKDDPVNAVTEWVSQTAATDIYLARRFIKRERYSLAKRKYRDALDKNPGNSVILNELARAEKKTGETEKAEKYFLKAIENNPHYAPPFKHLGDFYLEMKDYSLAENYLKRYLYIQPFDPAVHRFLKELYSRQGEDKLKDKEEKALEILNES
ncbi:MAG: peptidase MA family metallohydrolase [Elusimicrobiota bacterium]|nr:peptidase MA family metallohydrolase [Elusimicrobiota bacterium]